MVAVTGLALVLFVIGHLIGNLQVFAGGGDATQSAKMNTYAAFLKSLGGLVWVARIGLIVMVVAHIVATIKLTVENRAAKGGGAALKKRVQAKLSTRTMIWSGSYIVAFVLFHLAHFTTISIYPEWRNLHDARGLHDVQAMVLIGFSNPLVCAFYIVGMLLLCSHMSHGIASVAQTLGVQTQKMRACFQMTGRAVAVLLAVGYISIPVAVQAGFGKAYKDAAVAKLAAMENKEGK